MSSDPKSSANKYELDAYLIIQNAHGTVSLIMARSRLIRAVHGDHQIVGAEAVPVGVIVREKTSLKHLVRRGLDSRHQICWWVSSLFNLKVKKNKLQNYRKLALTAKKCTFKWFICSFYIRSFVLPPQNSS